MCKSYNGYTNYETWNVSLWIDNDEGLYSQVQDMTRDNIENEDTTVQLADSIKDMIEEYNPLMGQASMFSDLMQAALDSVNWYEIAENWIENANEYN